ncbi:MAG: hypothetical protein ACTTKL_07550 [Treponema sp.]
MFEKVNFAFYSGELGRTAIPDEEAFNQYALKNLQFVKGLADDGLIVEREDDGIDKAVCMMIEEDYAAGGETRAVIMERDRYNGDPPAASLSYAKLEI